METSIQRRRYLVPDKWEYPWYAAWDLAFHCISLALVDSEFAKHQLILLRANGINIRTADSRLRMGVFRRESAGSRLGSAQGLSNRSKALRAALDAIFLKEFFTTAF